MRHIFTKGLTCALILALGMATGPADGAGNKYKATKEITIDKPVPWQKSKNDPRAFKSRGGHLLEQTSASPGNSGWTGWASFYRTLAVPENSVGAGRSVRAHPDFMWLPHASATGCA